MIVSEYMAWAKQIGLAPTKYELTGSGMPSGRWDKLPVQDLPLWSRHFYGAPLLKERVAALAGARPEQVLIASGTSLANFLVASACLERGDRVVIETPTYEPLAQTLAYLGAQLVPLPRPWSARFQPDPEDLARVLPGAKLVVLTNLHNPTGVAIDPDRLAAITRATELAGVPLLVDQVYLDFLENPPHAQGPHVITTQSLTKVYGLTGLRTGWAIGPEPLIRRAWEIKNFMSVIDPYPIEELATRILGDRERYRQPLLAHARAGQQILADWARREELEVITPPGGIIVALKLPAGLDAPRLVDHLVTRHDTRVVPGDFFALPGFVRVGVGDDHTLLAEGLRRLATAIREL